MTDTSKSIEVKCTEPTCEVVAVIDPRHLILKVSNQFKGMSYPQWTLAILDRENALKLAREVIACLEPSEVK